MEHFRHNDICDFLRKLVQMESAEVCKRFQLEVHLTEGLTKRLPLGVLMYWSGERLYFATAPAWSREV